MSHAKAAALGERVGSRTGIVTRTSKKYLAKSGIELVPVDDLDRPHACAVYYRGTEVTRLDAAKCPTGPALVAAVYNAVAWHLHQAAGGPTETAR